MDAVLKPAAAATPMGSNAERRRKARRRRRRFRLVTVWIARVAVIVLPLYAWERAANSKSIDPFLYSQPSSIWDRLQLWWDDGTIADNIWFTVRNALVGYVLGLVLGSMIAVLFVAAPKIGRIYLPVMTTVNAVPRFAFAPLFIAWVGFGARSAILLVIIVTLFINFFSIHGGLSSIDNSYMQWSRALGANEIKVWTTVRIPAIVGWILSSLRLSIGLAFSAAVVAEFVGGAVGMGHLISMSVNTFRSAGVFAGMAAIISLIIVIDGLIRILERRWTHWVGFG